MKDTKYTCKRNLEHMDFYIHRIYNKNLKMDYNKIYNKLTEELSEIESNLKSPLDKTFELYLLNYKIEYHMQKLGRHGF